MVIDILFQICWQGYRCYSFPTCFHEASFRCTVWRTISYGPDVNVCVEHRLSPYLANICRLEKSIRV